MSERTEAELRRALRSEADHVDVDPNAWRTVQHRVRRTRTRRRAGAALAGTAAVVVGVLVVTSNIGDDGTTVDVVPADESTTTETPLVLDPDMELPLFLGIWPFSSRNDVLAYSSDPGAGIFFDAQATALEFGREYLDMPEPTVVAQRTAEDEVDIVAKPTSPAITTVDVRQTDVGVYVVYGSRTSNIEVEMPAAGDAVGTKITLEGTSTAFEANVNVEVRDDEGRTLGETFVMGGANGEMAPFRGEIEIEQPTTAGGAVIFRTESMEDGTSQEATVVRIAFAGRQSGTEYSVFFHRGEELVEVVRQGSPTLGVLRQALEALVAGPLPEDGDDLDSLFSEETADILAGVNVREGTAIVDFAEPVNNASTSAGSVYFRESLNATIFQFPTIQRIEYRLDGSCDAFWQWQQVGDCELVERPERS